jgi:hypothetical protein
MFEQTLLLVATLVGFAALFAVLINIGKTVGFIKDGDAPMWSTGLNLALVLVVYAFRIFRPEFDFATVDPIAQEVATVGAYILTFVSQLLVSKLTNYAVKGTPVVGKSFSNEKKG